MMFTSDELTCLFDADLGTEARVFPMWNVLSGAVWGGEGKAVRGRFSAAFVSIDLAAGSAESRGPQFQTSDDDAEDVQPGDVLQISGAKYKVTGKQPAGSGITALILSQD